MATKTWIGNAHATRQITTITVAGTWLDTETATLTINTKDLVLTLVGNEATTAVATALKEMWMASRRLDGTGSTDATSNAGGQEFGEFSEVTATVSGSVVTLTANHPGVPFTVSVAESSAGGTLTPATPQAATGPWHWDNADNWDTGTVPANDDIVVFRDSNVSCLYGLPNASLEVTIQQHMTYTGEIGLHRINRTDPSKPYNEYRQRYVRLDDAGGGSDIAHRFGIGQAGIGSRLINVRHATVKCSPVVYNTAQPDPNRPGTYALNICCSNNTSTLSILNGFVDFGTQDSTTAAFVTVRQTAGTSRGFNAMHTTGARVTCSGGRMVIGGTGAISIIEAKTGGSIRVEDQTGAVSSLDIYDKSTIEYTSTATITTLYVYGGGTFDARSTLGDFTVGGSVQIYAGATYLDPQQRTAPVAFTLNCEPDEATIKIGGGINSQLAITW